MRIINILLFACLVFAVQFVHAGEQNLSPNALIGSWTKSGTLPDGKLMTVDCTFSQDNKFNGKAIVQSDEIWKFSGTWEIKSGQLIYHYESSSLPLPDNLKTDIDDIVSVSADELVLISRLSGEKHVFLKKQSNEKDAPDQKPVR